MGGLVPFSLMIGPLGSSKDYFATVDKHVYIYVRIASNGTRIYHLNSCKEPN